MDDKWDKNLNFGGFLQISTVDWPEKVVSLVFMRGCPMRCVYCQNHSILGGEDVRPIGYIENEIKKAVMLIDGVVLSGGEPMMQPDAVEHILRFVRDLNLSTGIQTNGFYPERIASMVSQGLVDRVAVDVKAPMNNEEMYEQICGVSGAIDRVRESIKVCDGRVELELRTTVMRNLLDVEDIRAVASEVSDVDCTYVIQQALPEQGWREDLKNVEPFSRDDMMTFGKAAKEHLDDVRIRTRENGEERVE